MATEKTRQKILKTFLEMLAETPYDEISMPGVADAAGVKLSTLRDCYASKLDLVEGFAKQIDKAVLDDRDEDMGDQHPRDRLFDILMTRLDHLDGYKDVVRALRAAASADASLALSFNSIMVRSQRWMMIAAGIDIPGFKGRAAAQGLAVTWARVLDTWLAEEDEGMPKTMALLDRELERGETWIGRLGRLERFAAPIWRGMRKGAKRRRDRKSEPATEETPDAEPAPAG